MLHIPLGVFMLSLLNVSSRFTYRSHRMENTDFSHPGNSTCFPAITVGYMAVFMTLATIPHTSPYPHSVALS